MIRAVTEVEELVGVVEKRGHFSELAAEHAARYFFSLRSSVEEANEATLAFRSGHPSADRRLRRGEAGILF